MCPSCFAFRHEAQLEFRYCNWMGLHSAVSPRDFFADLDSVVSVVPNGLPAMHYLLGPDEAMER